jgi:hypothetical protein
MPLNKVVSTCMRRMTLTGPSSNGSPITSEAPLGTACTSTTRWVFRSRRTPTPTGPIARILSVQRQATVSSLVILSWHGPQNARRRFHDQAPRPSITESPTPPLNAAGCVSFFGSCMSSSTKQVSCITATSLPSTSCRIQFITDALNISRSIFILFARRSPSKSCAIC